MSDANSCSSDRRQAAYHEAGHAIVSWSFGIKVTRLHVQDNGDGQTGADSPNHLPGPDQIAILMAGWAGAGLGGCPYPSLKHAKLTRDRCEAEKLAADILGSNDIDADPAEIRAKLVKGRDEARSIIKMHRASFKTIAEELLLRGELLADEIANLLPKGDL